MTDLITTPRFIIAAIAAIAIGVTAAMFSAQQTAPRTLAMPIAAPAGPQTAVGSFNPAMIHQQRILGVVTIQAVFGTDVVQGSGFVADADGRLVTDSHVVRDYARGAAQADAIYVTFASHDRVQATEAGIDAYSDIAVLKVDPSEVELHPIPMGSSDTVIAGEPIAAIGAPFDNAGSITTGIVSAVHRTPKSGVSTADVADAIQVDAAINHGNSGGPVFNRRGEVIGISQQILSKTEMSGGVAFAIPINTVKRTLRQIVDNGRVRYAHLGLTTVTVSPQLARHLKLPAEHGVLVQEVSGPAAAAGIAGATRSILFLGETIPVGDEIVSIGGVAVASREDVTRLVNQLQPGDPVQVSLYHDGHHKTVTVVPDDKQL